MPVTKPKLNGTHLIHGDAIVPVTGGEVAPSISVTTSTFHIYPRPELAVYVLLAFRAPNPDDSSLADIDMRNPSRHVYSRYTQQVSSRVEQVLSRINVSGVEASRLNP